MAREFIYLGGIITYDAIDNKYIKIRIAIATSEETEEAQQSHGSIMSTNGLGSTKINVLEQLRIEKCGESADQDPLF